MATNLLIGYPDIPNAATISATTYAADTSWPYENLFGGNKTDLFMLAASQPSGDSRITFELPSGTTKASNFFYISRANLLQQAFVGTITIKANTSNNYATATTIATYSSFGSQSLYGPAEDDFINKFSTSAAYRYWFINYNTTAASKIPHAKLFFGSYFDIGIDPNANATITRLKVGGGQRRANFSFEFTWEGVQYAKAVEMYEKFYRTRRYMPLVIFTDTWHDILMGNRAVFCRMTEMQMPPRVTDYCDVSAVFEEMP